MPDVNELIKVYEKYSDEELYTLFITLDDYSEDAREAFRKVVDKRGGVATLKEQHKMQQTGITEERRIRNEVTGIFSKQNENSWSSPALQSDIFSPDQVQMIINDQIRLLKLEREDLLINSRTISRSIIGGLIAAVAGGILWGIQLIYAKRLIEFLILGLWILCYGIIRFFTRQSKKNKLVWFTSMIATGLALVLGWWIFQQFGNTEQFK